MRELMALGFGPALARRLDAINAGAPVDGGYGATVIDRVLLADHYAAALGLRLRTYKVTVDQYRAAGLRLLHEPWAGGWDVRGCFLYGVRGFVYLRIKT